MPWPQLVLGNSENFLCDVIHPRVESLYYDPSLLQQYQNDILKAQKLQQYLYDLKNFQKNLTNGTNIFEKYEYEAFMDIYGNIANLDNISLSKGIFHQRKGIDFEKELTAIQKSLKALFEKNDNLTFEENISLSGKISLGQAYTKINIPQEKMMDKIVQQTLKLAKVKTEKYLTEESKKASKRKNSQQQKYLYVQDVNPKIDISTNSILISQEMKYLAPNLANFAQLYSKSKITAKNYLESSIQKYGISLGKTNMFRILTDFIPTLDILKDQSLLLSFQYAIFTRRWGNFSGRSDKAVIDQHFHHISSIYELMGVGQNIYSKYTDLTQLRDFLKQGADFLIVNVRDSDKIYVKSTRELLVKMYQQMGFGNTRRVSSLRMSYLT